MVDYQVGKLIHIKIHLGMSYEFELSALVAWWQTDQPHAHLGYQKENLQPKVTRFISLFYCLILQKFCKMLCQNLLLDGSKLPQTWSTCRKQFLAALHIAPLHRNRIFPEIFGRAKATVAVCLHFAHHFKFCFCQYHSSQLL